MAKALICSQCSSTDLVQIDPYQYSCNHCGTRLHIGTLPDKKTERPYYRDNRPVAKAGLKRVIIGIAVAFLVMGGIGYFTIEQKAPDSVRIDHSSTQRSKRAMSSFEQDAIEKEKVLKGTFKNTAILPDSIGNIYVVGIAKNIGEGIIRRPHVEVHLLNEAEKKIVVSAGYGFRDYLLPGEETAVKILVKDAPKYAKIKTVFEAEKPFHVSDRPKLKISQAKIKPGKYSGYTVSGKVTNVGSVGARFVKVGSLFYDKENKIIAMHSGYLGQKKLPPGDSAPFSFSVHLVKGKPERFTVDYEAMVAK